MTNNTDIEGELLNLFEDIPKDAMKDIVYEMVKDRLKIIKVYAQELYESDHEDDEIWHYWRAITYRYMAMRKSTTYDTFSLLVDRLYDTSLQNKPKWLLRAAAAIFVYMANPPITDHYKVHILESPPYEAEAYISHLLRQNDKMFQYRISHDIAAPSESKEPDDEFYRTLEGIISSTFFDTDKEPPSNEAIFHESVIKMEEVLDKMRQDGALDENADKRHIGMMLDCASCIIGCRTKYTAT